MNAEDDHNYVSSRNNNSNDDYDPNSDGLENNPQRPQNTDHDYLARSPSNRSYAENIDNVDESLNPANEVQSVNLDVNAQENNAPVIDDPTTSSSVTTPTGHVKKRKRLSLASPSQNTPKVKANSSFIDLEEDDGITCPICLEHWEMSGEHRLVALKCGHLFGNSCIRRWLSESSKQSGQKLCPQCKTKATYKDIRCLYAKRLRAIDRTEEYSLREKVKEEESRVLKLQTELSTYKLSASLATKKISTLETENKHLKEIICKNAIGNTALPSHNLHLVHCLPNYKLFLDRNIEICRESGCRVMVNADKKFTLIVSQKSSQTLFPGYGVRFIDTHTFRTSNFLHTSAKLVRDISLNSNQHLIATASMEVKTKIYDLRTRHMTMMLSATDNSLSWACAMDLCIEREDYIYIGGNLGTTFIYDMRFPSAVLDEFKNEGDCSPVINVSLIPANKYFSNGGFAVCKLQSVWFHEYESDNISVKSTRFDIDGPFISMKYDEKSDTLLISARNNARFACARYMLGRLEKIDETPVFNLIINFFGSKATPVMTRCTQIGLGVNTLIAGYLQDAKMLTIFDEKRADKIQSLPVSDIVYDICPIYGSDSYLAALTETKCRIYKLTST